jgi:hypothetical protein
MFSSVCFRLPASLFTPSRANETRESFPGVRVRLTTQHNSMIVCIVGNNSAGSVWQNSWVGISCVHNVNVTYNSK